MINAAFIKNHMEMYIRYRNHTLLFRDDDTLLLAPLKFKIMDNLPRINSEDYNTRKKSRHIVRDAF